MKFLAFIVLCCLSTLALANDAYLRLMTVLKPTYPRELLKTAHAGKVLVELTINASGKVEKTRITESSHPKLAEAAQQTLAKWRYQPWNTTQGRPEKVHITVPIIFSAHGLEPFSKEISVGLENTRCSYLNQEVELSERNFPQEPLSKVDVFWHTRRYLTSDYVNWQVPNKAKRSTLLTELDKALPAIVKACKQDPEARYGTYLPHEIRGVLVSHH